MTAAAPRADEGAERPAKDLMAALMESLEKAKADRPASSGDGGAPTDPYDTLHMLDVFLALGGTDEEFAEWIDGRAFADAWPQLVAAVAGRIDSLRADSNPPAGVLLKIAERRPAPSPVPEEGPPTCTGLAASWCPNHGDCSCPRDEDGDGDFTDGDQDDQTCPLHSDASDHPIPTVPELVRLPNPALVPGDGPLCWLPEGRWVRAERARIVAWDGSAFTDVAAEYTDGEPMWRIPGATPEQGEGPDQYVEQAVQRQILSDLRTAASAVRGASWPGELAQAMESRADRLVRLADALAADPITLEDVAAALWHREIDDAPSEPLHG